MASKFEGINSDALTHCSLNCHR